ncbi:MAG: VCBS repeat-containing protein [Candidatus Electryonea clarkiae]|nr:VCBS repeat-containing protein [Candidatus Electryonea clarkiae]
MRFNSLSIIIEYDGNPIIAVTTLHQAALYNLSGTILFGWPKSFNYPFVGTGLASGDIEGDGNLDVVMMLRDRTTKLRELVSFGIDGIEKIKLRKTFELTNPVISPPVLINIDGDSRNTDEIIFIGDSLYVIDGNGVNLPSFPWGLDGTPHWTVGPVVGTGTIWQESVIFWISVKDDSALFHARPINSTKELFGWPVKMKKSSFMSTPILIEFESDWNIVTGSRDYIYVFKSNGDLRDGFPFNPYKPRRNRTLKRISIGDIDGDDSPDIVFNLMDEYMHVVNLDGEYLPGFPFILGTNGKGEPCTIFGDAKTDSALIFTASQPDSFWYNELYGLRYNQILDGFPLSYFARLVYSSTALIPTFNSVLHLVYSTNNGMTSVWDLPIASLGTSMEWAMEGCTPDGNRCYRIEDHRIQSCEQTEFITENIPICSHLGSKSVSFCLFPESTGEVKVLILDLSGKLVLGKSFPVWAGLRSRIEFSKYDLNLYNINNGIYIGSPEKVFFRQICAFRLIKSSWLFCINHVFLFLAVIL